MPEAQPKYPNDIDDDTSLIEVKDNKYTTLTVRVDVAVTIFEVNSTEGFPDSGYLTVDSEIVRYLEKDATHFGTVANPLERGMQETTAAPHEAGDKIYLFVLSIHHNVLKNGLIKVEEELGTNPKGIFTNVKERIDKLLKYDSDYRSFVVEQ